MKSLIALYVLIILASTFGDVIGSESQFALVQDPDGFVNVRKTASLDGEVIAKVDHGAFVYTFGVKPKDGWVGVQYRFPWSDRYFGYIHESRLKRLNEFERIPEKRNGETLVFDSGKLKVEIEEEAFDSFNVPVTIVRHKGHETVSEINQKRFYGTDGGLPRTKYRSIIITRGGKKLELPDEAIGDLFEPNLIPDYHHLYYDKATDTAFLTGSNSDGAGGYCVLFRIVKGKYQDRFLFSGA